MLLIIRGGVFLDGQVEVVLLPVDGVSFGWSRIGGRRRRVREVLLGNGRERCEVHGGQRN